MDHGQLCLGDIAARHPHATRVFHRHHLDYCCGGLTTLAEACSARHLDPDEVWNEVVESEKVPGVAPRLDERPIPEIIDYILTRFHRPLRDEMPRLVSLARKVESVHAAHPSCPRGLAEHLERMQAELEEHMSKEELILFPLLASGGARMAAMPIRVMLQEHQDHGRNLETLRRLAGEGAPETGGCATWSALAIGVDDLDRDLMEHIHVENNVLFPKCR